MKVDVQALGTFNRLAHEGAEHAAASLSQLTDVRPTVETTKVDLVERETAGDEFGAFVGVEMVFAGDIAGRAVLAVEESRAEALTDSLPVGGDTREQVTEVGNILIGGFLDGWADYLGTAIDIEPPEYVSGAGNEVVPDDASLGPDGQVFSFRSQLRTTAEDIDASIYLFPEESAFAGALAETGGDAPVPIDKLAVFNKMARRGAGNASDHLTSMTGIETTVDVSRISFAPVEEVPAQIADERHLGVVLEFTGLPSGYLLVLFDADSARRVADALVPGDGEFGEMHQSAIQEVGNVVTSGFVDGWANVLDTTIDISPPEYVDDLGRAIMDPVAARLGRQQEYAFVIDSTIRTPDDVVGCNIFALPDEAELREALSAIDLDAAEAVEIADPEVAFADDGEP
jgi:chemotaxis protein CheC